MNTGIPSVCKFSRFVLQFGRTIMNIFVSDTAIIENAVRGIHITSIFFIALGTAQILRYLLNGAGDSAYSRAKKRIFF